MGSYLELPEIFWRCISALRNFESLPALAGANISAHFRRQERLSARARVKALIHQPVSIFILLTQHMLNVEDVELLDQKARFVIQRLQAGAAHLVPALHLAYKQFRIAEDLQRLILRPGGIF